MRGDLWRIGYASVPFRVRACEVYLPHERSRCFIVANSNNTISRNDGGEGRSYWKSVLRLAFEEQKRVSVENETNSYFKSKQMGGSRFTREKTGGLQGSIEPCLVRGIHGVPNRVDRVKALGNAVVPQVAMVIGFIIKNLQTRYMNHYKFIKPITL